MTGAWMVLLGIVAVGVVFVVLLTMADTFLRYRAKRMVHCPVENKPARVLVDAALAALTAVPGPAKLRIDRCSFWPDRADCAQRCTRYLV
jgi:hypothetical protein